MDHNIRTLVVASLGVVLAIVLLIWFRLHEHAPAEAAAPRPAASEPPAPVAALKPVPAAPPPAASGDSDGAVSSDAGADELARVPPPSPAAPRVKRFRKGRRVKGAKLTDQELEKALRDPEDQADDVREQNAEALAIAEKLGSPDALRAAIRAEDQQSAGEQRGEDELLGGAGRERR